MRVALLYRECERGMTVGQCHQGIDPFLMSIAVLRGDLSAGEHIRFGFCTCIIFFLHYYPFKPEVAMPSTKYFCAAKNNIISGNTTTNEVAIILPQFTTDSESSESRSASETVYLVPELMKINELK